MEWPDKPPIARTIAPHCPKCGWDGELEIGATPGGLILATIGLNIVFDPADYVPPENFMPGAIKCRGCRRIFTAAPEVADVR